MEEPIDWSDTHEGAAFRRFEKLAARWSRRKSEELDLFHPERPTPSESAPEFSPRAFRLSNPACISLVPQALHYENRKGAWRLLTAPTSRAVWKLLIAHGVPLPLFLHMACDNPPRRWEEVPLGERKKALANIRSSLVRLSSGLRGTPLEKHVVGRVGETLGGYHVYPNRMTPFFVEQISKVRIVESLADLAARLNEPELLVESVDRHDDAQTFRRYVGRIGQTLTSLKPVQAATVAQTCCELVRGEFHEKDVRQFLRYINSDPASKTEEDLNN